MTGARIPPAEPPYSESFTAALARLMPAGVPPLLLFRSLAVNERVMGKMMAGGLLDKGSISLRERELVIDRTCWRCGSEYEWGVHVAFFGEKVRLTPEEVRGLCSDDVEATPFSPREKLLLRLCDELHASATVSDALWAELAKEWTAPQLLELLALAGYYHTISYLTNALRLPLESFAARFPSP
ncbi:carboxymuconolactone decarboxylase family protein [Myxococcus sp. RHSTA-1-4]|uniref:carboxymuconolactone decarboxylase family protein n=1 Tax=Myxococcus sp. RHSTA-1-4 TaxID=2874601 RepID=UPI001CBB19BC|nr:carboxymuconolactone decarboxylase family protein [Myxococcus sp. RHSTA-1-4]MBZ4421401.1 carboxymuconolactone decarboxylase family protein [Myxococcus sp. RHSTA-1-4]